MKKNLLSPCVKAIKTVRVKLHHLTIVKKRLLNQEYENFQKAVRGEDAKLYASTKQRAWLVRRQRKPKNEQPIRLRNDRIRIEEQDTKISKYWIKIPVYNPEKKRGDSIWCPAIVPHKYEKEVEECKFGESELVRNGEDWFVHLVIKKESEISKSFSDIIAVDMGVRWIATSVALSNRKTKFYDRKIREIREHYKMLRKKIGKKKVNKGRQIIKRIGNAESRAVEDRLHKISRKIVEEAREKTAIIAIGDLKGISENGNKGRKFNDKLHKFPFDKLMRFIQYKAEWKGVEVVKVGERDTSKTCNRCGSKKTSRIGQGKFVCKDCGLKDNADKNAALNIAKRAIGKSVETPLSKAGVLLSVPKTPAENVQISDRGTSRL